jgi:hypothetical protein
LRTSATTTTFRNQLLQVAYDPLQFVYLGFQLVACFNRQVLPPV